MIQTLSAIVFGDSAVMIIVTASIMDVFWDWKPCAVQIQRRWRSYHRAVCNTNTRTLEKACEHKYSSQHGRKISSVLRHASHWLRNRFCRSNTATTSVLQRPLSRVNLCKHVTTWINKNARACQSMLLKWQVATAFSSSILNFFPLILPFKRWSCFCMATIATKHPEMWVLLRLACHCMSTHAVRKSMSTHPWPFICSMFLGWVARNGSSFPLWWITWAHMSQCLGQATNKMRVRLI